MLSGSYQGFGILGESYSVKFTGISPVYLLHFYFAESNILKISNLQLIWVNCLPLLG